MTRALTASTFVAVLILAACSGSPSSPSGTTASSANASGTTGQIGPAEIISNVTIKKYTNGHDADETPGPLIPVGSPVTWSYVITNRTGYAFTSLLVTDDRGVAVDCPKTLPAPGASMTCTGSGVATAGQYANVGTVRATANGTQYTASDTSHYFGVAATGVSIKKYTNGHDADDAPGPLIPIGTPVTWAYVITNRSPAAFTSLLVTDDRGVAVACPKTLPPPGESITCTGSGVATAGQYANVGTVTATANGIPYTASDVSHYFGVTASEATLKVQLCHKTGNGSYHLIEVSVDAEPAHLAHGDGKPGEPVPGNPGKVFTAACEVR